MLESIIRKRIQESQKNELLIKENLYSDYIETPINVEEASWQNIAMRDKNILQKSFLFKNTKLLMYFLNELYAICEEVSHIPDISIKDFTVTIDLFTKDFNDITDIDVELSQKIDEIIEDIELIQFGRY